MKLCKVLPKNQSISGEKVFWWTGERVQVSTQMQSRWFTAKRLCIHKMPGLLLTHNTTETYTPIFQLHQHPPLGLHNYMQCPRYTKYCGPACLCLLQTVLTGSSESHILPSLICLIINDTSCQHQRLRMRTETADFFLLPMMLNITPTLQTRRDHPECHWYQTHKEELAPHSNLNYGGGVLVFIWIIRHDHYQNVEHPL